MFVPNKSSLHLLEGGGGLVGSRTPASCALPEVARGLRPPWGGSSRSLAGTATPLHPPAPLPGAAARAGTHHPTCHVIRLIGKCYQTVIIAICINIGELIGGSSCSLQAWAQGACICDELQFWGKNREEMGAEEEAPGLCGITLCSLREEPCTSSLQDVPLGLKC